MSPETVPVNRPVIAAFTITKDAFIVLASAVNCNHCTISHLHHELSTPFSKEHCYEHKVTPTKIRHDKTYS